MIKKYVLSSVLMALVPVAHSACGISSAEYKDGQVALEFSKGYWKFEDKKGRYGLVNGSEVVEFFYSANGSETIQTGSTLKFAEDAEVVLFIPHESCVVEFKVKDQKPYLDITTHSLHPGRPLRTEKFEMPVKHSGSK